MKKTREENKREREPICGGKSVATVYTNYSALEHQMPLVGVHASSYNVCYNGNEENSYYMQMLGCSKTSWSGS